MSLLSFMSKKKTHKIFSKLDEDTFLLRIYIYFKTNTQYHLNISVYQPILTLSGVPVLGFVDNHSGITAAPTQDHLQLTTLEFK